MRACARWHDSRTYTPRPPGLYSITITAAMASWRLRAAIARKYKPEVVESWRYSEANYSRRAMVSCKVPPTMNMSEEGPSDEGGAPLAWACEVIDIV